MSLNRYGFIYDWNIRLNIDDKQLRILEQIKQFVVSSQGIVFNGINLKEKYYWTEEKLALSKARHLLVLGDGDAWMKTSPRAPTS